MSLLKIVIFLIIFAGVAIYATQQSPSIINWFENRPAPFSGLPEQKPAPTYTPSYSAPTPTPSVPIPTSTISQPEIPDYRIPSGFSREQLSPYFEKVYISSFSFYSWGNYPKTLGLYYYLAENESINISGWKIKGNRFEIFIPRAINVFSAEGPNVESDIILSKNGSLYIYSNKSPLEKNLRLNKCGGYLNNFYDFNPDLPQTCPAISKSEISHLSGECQNYLFSLVGSCKMPETSFYNSLPGTDEGNACRAFLNTIGYGSCFRKYSRESDFLQNDWRLWLDVDFKFDLLHDRLLLFDKDRLLVDEYVY